jgi:SAM-dependent methyltransferase
MRSALEHGSAALDSLRVSLRTAGYTKDAVSEATSATDLVTVPGLGAAVGYVQTERDEPIASLARLFSIGAAETRERVDRLLPHLDVDGLAAAGVLRVGDSKIRSALQIAEVDGLLVASDFDRTREDWVIGVSSSTMLAAAHAPRVRARSALDVGTGAGLHALLAARHCDRVVATDFNPRACWMTELNARLNEIDKVETRVGSFFEPVEGERFDLVVVNPPYVISPTVRFLYRDGGFEGDGLCRKLLGELPDFLTDGGFATLQCNWIHDAGERWYAPIERALAGGGCDAVMARISTADPLAYATNWNEAHHVGDEEGYQRVVREWVDHFEANGIERISAAMVVLRRRPDARNWRRAVSLARQPEEVGGKELAALFDVQDRLAELDDEGLLDARLRVPPELRVERYERPGREASCVLDLDTAIGVRRPVPPKLADVVLKLDGSAPLRTVDGAGDQVDGLRALIKLGYVTFA